MEPAPLRSKDAAALARYEAVRSTHSYEASWFNNATFVFPLVASLIAGVVWLATGSGEAGGAAINRSYATANVTGTGEYLGGLVGRNNGNIRDASASGDVRGFITVGGLVGSNLTGGSISDSRADGAVSDSHEDGPKSHHGGLVGQNFGQISRSVATGDICGGGQTNGGLGREERGRHQPKCGDGNGEILRRRIGRVP